MKIVTVVGARPQFIKAAAVSRVLRLSHREILVHTGQHYDKDMSDIFFEELSIPKPDYNLGVGSGPHGKQTGEMLEKTEEVLLKEKPDAVLVYGDTNSTLAGALAASKLLIPVAHVEAGLRSYNRAMPEEQNRVLTDHLARWLFCPTQTAAAQLGREGVSEGVSVVGDVMYDALLYYKKDALGKYNGTTPGELEHLLPFTGNFENGWYLATIHRAENTQDERNLSEILRAFESLDAPVVFPVHPRTRAIVLRLAGEQGCRNVCLTHPVGYLRMIYLASKAKKIVTDSGGLQKEAYLLGVPCVTVREQTEWVETLEGSWNVLSHAKAEDILEKVLRVSADAKIHPDYYGDGFAANRIRELLENS